MVILQELMTLNKCLKIIAFRNVFITSEFIVSKNLFLHQLIKYAINNL